jgi:hypothetical protein
MDRQTLQDWVLRYNELGADGLAPRALVISGPDPALHKVARCRRVYLRDEVTRRFGITLAERTIGKWPRRLRLTRLQPLPVHPKKDPAAEEAFKKTSVSC